MTAAGVVYSIIVCVCVALIVGFNAYTGGYRAGQIDALNHRIFYHLERQEDGSQVWAACAEVCEGE